MNQTKYVATTADGFNMYVWAFNLNEAIILAKAKAITNGLRHDNIKVEREELALSRFFVKI